MGNSRIIPYQNFWIFLRYKYEILWQVLELELHWYSRIRNVNIVELFYLSMHIYQFDIEKYFYLRIFVPKIFVPMMMAAKA